MTEAERLRERCPTCHMPPGKKCVDPKLEETPRCHRTRGPGQYDKHLQAALDRKTQREKASYGPLFQEVAEAEVRRPTLEEAKLADRMAEARSFDQDKTNSEIAIEFHTNNHVVKGIRTGRTWKNVANEKET